MVANQRWAILIWKPAGDNVLHEDTACLLFYSLFIFSTSSTSIYKPRVRTCPASPAAPYEKKPHASSPTLPKRQKFRQGKEAQGQHKVSNNSKPAQGKHKTDTRQATTAHQHKGSTRGQQGQQQQKTNRKPKRLTKKMSLIRIMFIFIFRRRPSDGARGDGGSLTLPQRQSPRQEKSQQKD